MIIHLDQGIVANHGLWNNFFQWGIAIFWESGSPRWGFNLQISANLDDRRYFFAFPLNFQFCRSQTNNYISVSREKQVYPVPAKLNRNTPL
jgi:hypothetical protein